MAGRNKKKKSSNNHQLTKKQSPPIKESSHVSNFVQDAGPGCYIARYDMPNNSKPSWMIGWEYNINPSDYVNDHSDFDAFPDLALDPEEQTISICNVRSTTRVCYVTVYETTLLSAADGNPPLTMGTTTDNEGNQQSCITFIVLCPPKTFCHLAYIDLKDGLDIFSIQIDSDIQDWNKHPNPKFFVKRPIGFPLVCSDDRDDISSTGDGGDSGDNIESSNSKRGGPFLCTQGVDGELTHFFAGNLHSIDFRCKVGTPVVAVGDGIIRDVQDLNKLSGIAVSNLFKWNSIMLELDSGDTADDSNDNSDDDTGKQETKKLFVEYVHIQESSSLVKVGDRVHKGQIICKSGNVGFSPEPHLHLSVFTSSEATASTVGFYFECCVAQEDKKEERGEKVTRNPKKVERKKKFLPKAGCWYDKYGEVSIQQK